MKKVWEDDKLKTMGLDSAEGTESYRLEPLPHHPERPRPTQPASGDWIEPEEPRTDHPRVMGRSRDQRPVRSQLSPAQRAARRQHEVMHPSETRPEYVTYTFV